jgi:hypothetical protein
VGCTNTAISYSRWITGVTTTYNNGGASATVNYTVAPNPAGTNRTGAVQIGDQTYTVTETGAACALSLNSYGASFGQAGGMGWVFGSPTAQGRMPSVGDNSAGVSHARGANGPDQRYIHAAVHSLGLQLGGDGDQARVRHIRRADVHRQANIIVRPEMERQEDQNMI